MCPGFNIAQLCIESPPTSWRDHRDWPRLMQAIQDLAKAHDDLETGQQFFESQALSWLWMQEESDEPGVPEDLPHANLFKAIYDLLFKIVSEKRGDQQPQQGEQGQRVTSSVSYPPRNSPQKRRRTDQIHPIAQAVVGPMTRGSSQSFSDLESAPQKRRRMTPQQQMVVSQQMASQKQTAPQQQPTLWEQFLSLQ